ncbi:MAG: hypothetical protein ACJ8R9_22630 [Steroidobacteraceae bacterium]
MSLSSRNLNGAGARWPYALPLCLCTTVLLAPAARAQRVSFVPAVQTTAEYDTNRLLSQHKQGGEWYEARLSADLMRETVRSTLEVLPQVSLQESSYKALKTFEGQLGMRGEYRSERTDYKGVATYHRQDAYNSEYGVVQFDPLNPGAPNTVGTGEVVTGITRQSWNIGPNITHDFTQRFSGEFDANYNAVRYSREIPQTLVSFDSPYVELDALWRLSQLTAIGLGPFYSAYRPVNGFENGALRSDSYGAVFTYRYRTAQTANFSIDLKVGKDEQDQFDGSKRSVTAWGLEWRGSQQWLTSRLQYSVGRFLEPSSVGGEVGLYQIRAQYTRSFGPRLSGLLATRLSRTSRLGQSSDNRDRSYGEASVQYALTREWTLQGGLRYGWQKLSSKVSAVHNEGVFITVGFHGLNPHR